MRRSRSQRRGWVSAWKGLGPQHIIDGRSGVGLLAVARLAMRTGQKQLGNLSRMRALRPGLYAVKALTGVRALPPIGENPGAAPVKVS
jgi:hypothetical protein